LQTTVFKRVSSKVSVAINHYQTEQLNEYHNTIRFGLIFTRHIMVPCVTVKLLIH